MKNLIRKILNEGDFDWVGNIESLDVPPSSDKWAIFFETHQEWDDIQDWLIENGREWASGFGQSYLDWDNESVFFHRPQHEPTEFDAKKYYTTNNWEGDGYEIYKWEGDGIITLIN